MEHLLTVSSASGSARIKTRLIKQVVAVACAAVLVCATSIGAYAYYNKTPTSYLSLDINPSVELGVNTFGKVISITAYNNDGKTILDGQNVMGSDVKNAVNTLVKSAMQKGFVAKDGSTVIAVTSETDNHTTADALQDAAEQGADSAVESGDDTATIQKENVALERRDEARKLGITPGKLNLIQKLQVLDPSITVDAYKDAKVTDITKKFVELKKETLSNQGNDGDNSSSSPVSEHSKAASQTSSNESEKASEAQSHAQSDNSKSDQNAKTKPDAGTSSSSIASNRSGSDTDTDTNTEESSNASNGNHAGATSNANHGHDVANSHKK
ncbi:membrane associated protein [Ethanoligenens harbinense YUAN-3]|uniref:Membrane associated protein n=2 Tax=Ethanoligenens harbinense TaxID=253239 RepID=E6U4P3_ETHHY|nr:membrane associated protein [Ethanoligenens harbinense YUAN-3]